MNKKEMIFEVMNMYDEIERLNNQINDLRSENIRMKLKKQSEEINSIDYKMIEVAKELLLKKCLYSGNEVHVDYDEEKDIYTATNYERWLREKIILYEIPEKLSIHEFKTILDDELHEMYEKEKEEAIRNKKSEREENE